MFKFCWLLKLRFRWITWLNIFFRISINGFVVELDFSNEKRCSLESVSSLARKTYACYYWLQVLVFKFTVFLNQNVDFLHQRFKWKLSAWRSTSNRRLFFHSFRWNAYSATTANDAINSDISPYPDSCFLITIGLTSSMSSVSITNFFFEEDFERINYQGFFILTEPWSLYSA